MPRDSALSARMGGPARVGSLRGPIFAMLGLLGIVLVSFDPLHNATTVATNGDGDSLRQLSYLLIFAAALIGSGAARDLQRLLVLPLGITLVLGYFFLSISWAIEPGIALRRLVLTSMIIWVIFACVTQLGYERSVSLIRLVLVVVLILNYASMAFNPRSVHLMAEVVDQNLIGNWRGIHLHKNFAGAACAITVMFFVFDARRIGTAWRAAIIVAALFFLYKSASKTSLGLLVVSIVCGSIYGLYGRRWRRVGSVAVMAGVVIALLAAPLLWSLITAPFQREDAFSGRIQIWRVMIAYAQDHWLLGSGYGSFWNIGYESPVYHYTKTWVSLLYSAHSGYFEMLIQTGLPGFILAVWMTLVVPIAKIIGSTTAPPRQGALLLAMMIFCAAHNFTESSLYDRDMIVQVFLMLTIALVGVVTRPHPALRASHQLQG